MLQHIDVNLVEDRVTEVINSAVLDSEYKGITHILVNKVYELIDALPAEKRNLIGEIEDLRGKREIITYNELYRQGFIDGTRLSQLPFKAKRLYKLFGEFRKVFFKSLIHIKHILAPHLLSAVSKC